MVSKKQSEGLSLQQALTILRLKEACTLTDVGNSFQNGFDQYTEKITSDTIISQQNEFSWEQVMDQSVFLGD